MLVYSYIDDNLLDSTFFINCVKSDSHLNLKSVSLCVQISSSISPWKSMSDTCFLVSSKVRPHEVYIYNIHFPLL